MSHKHYSQGIAWMCFASLLFAVMAAAAKYCGTRLPASEIILVRSVAGSAVIAFLIHREKVSWIGKNPGVLASRGLIGFTALSLYFWTVSKIDLGTAVMLNYTSPIFALFWARYLGGEHPGRASRVAVLFAFAGVYLLSMPHFDAQVPALAAGLLSGILAGSVHVLIRRSHEKESALTIIFYFTVICTVGSFILLGLSGWVEPTRKEWLALAIVTVTSLLGQFGLTYALKYAPVPIVTPFGYLTPVVGAILGWIFWGAPLNALSLLGGALVITGGIVIYRSLKTPPVAKSLKVPDVSA